MQKNTREEQNAFWNQRTKQLIHHSHIMKQRATAVTDSLPAPTLLLYQSLKRGKTQFDMESILQSPASCASICGYLETMMESYQNIVAGRSEEQRRCWRLLRSRYFSPVKKSMIALCDQEHISKSTFYRCESFAVHQLSVLLFGVVAVF